jgi:hypothetical protein
MEGTVFKRTTKFERTQTVRENIRGDLAERNRRLMVENKSLRDRVQYLAAEKSASHADLARLSTHTGDPPPPDQTAEIEAKVQSLMLQDDAIEEFRQIAWIDSLSSPFQHWNRTTAEYRFPDGWPEGVAPADFIRTYHTRPSTAGEPEPPAAPPEPTPMHKLLSSIRS